VLFYAVIPTLIPCLLLFCYPYILLQLFSLFFYVTFLLAADTCLSLSLPSITAQQKVCLHRFLQYMYAVWAEKSLNQASVQAPSHCALAKPSFPVNAHGPYF